MSAKQILKFSLVTKFWIRNNIVKDAIDRGSSFGRDTNDWEISCWINNRSKLSDISVNFNES